jgi:ATP-dependent Lon protease
MSAYRSGLREVILPKSNEKDLRDLPDEVREGMAFTFVQAMDEVLRLALLPSPPHPLADQAPPKEEREEEIEVVEARK